MCDLFELSLLQLAVHAIAKFNPTKTQLGHNVMIPMSDTILLLWTVKHDLLH